MTGSLQTAVAPVSSLAAPGGETWQANVVDGTRVNLRLIQQWLRLKGPRPLRLSSAVRAIDSPSEIHVGPGVYARTNTTNLIIVARSAGQGQRAERAIAGLQTHYPTRAITIVSDPGLDRRAAENDAADRALTINTRLVQPDSPSSIVGHFESVTVTGGPRRLGNPLRAALPLCIPDLPVIVWWAGDTQYDFGLFRDLAEASDRVIVDSSSLGDVPRGLTTLSPLVGPGRVSGSVLADMAWLRLLDWRKLLAQFYDAPPHPETLSAISSVSVEYVTEPEPGQVAGLSSAILLVGWLASRLGWRQSDGVARTPAGLRLVFTSARNHPVVVRLRSSNDPVAMMGVAGVTMTSTGAAGAEYRVEQFSERELLTTSLLPGHPPMTRHVMVSPYDDSALLERVLQGPDHDPVFDEALAAVAVAFARR